MRLFIVSNASVLCLGVLELLITLTYIILIDILKSIIPKQTPLLNRFFTFSLAYMRRSHLLIDPQLLRRGAAQAVGVLKILANEDRLMLLCQLSQGEHCVSELQEELSISQPTLSQQLGVLRNEGVVNTRRQGKNIYYSVADPRTLEILVLLSRLYCPVEEN